MNYDAFSHGQTVSKVWLCEHLEPHLPEKAIVSVLGCWYNVLSFIMLSRDSNRYQYILGIDIDPEVIPIADKICNAWMIGDDSKVQHVVSDANTYDLHGFNVVINCSPEHMESNDWFHNIKEGTLVCIQTSNLDINDDVWKIVNPSRTTEEFAKKYPLSRTLVSAVKDIQYNDWGYKRYMLIGIK